MTDDKTTFGGCYRTGLAYSLAYDVPGGIELYGETFTNLNTGVDGGAIRSLRKYNDNFDSTRDIPLFIVSLKLVDVVEHEGVARCNNYEEDDTFYECV